MLDFGGLSDAAILRVVVADLHRTTGALADVDAYSDRVDDGLSLSTDMRGVEAVMTRDDFRELDNLLRCREASWRIHQARAHPERARSHRFVDVILHGAHLIRRRGPLLEAHRREPHAPVADEARDVDADASRPHELEIFPVRRPIPISRLRVVLESADRKLPISLADWRGRITAVPDHVRRDALSDRTLRPGLDEDADVAVRVNVDETGGDVRPRGVDRPLPFRTPEAAHACDLPTADSDVRDAPWGARAVRSESPQFPITCVVTPCRTAHSALGSTRMPMSLCV